MHQTFFICSPLYFQQRATHLRFNCSSDSVFEHFDSVGLEWLVQLVRGGIYQLEVSGARKTHAIFRENATDERKNIYSQERDINLNQTRDFLRQPQTFVGVNATTRTWSFNYSGQLAPTTSSP